MALAEEGMDVAAESNTEHSRHAFYKYHFNLRENLVDFSIALHCDFSDISSESSNLDSDCMSS
jgi:hypothetical protein